MHPSLLISPDCDDVALFAAYTVQAERPTIVVVFDSYAQPGRGHQGTDAAARRCEERDATRILSAGSQVHFLGFPDDQPLPAAAARGALAGIGADFAQRAASFGEELPVVWIPEPEKLGNARHNRLGWLSWDVFRGLGYQIRRYLTYTERGRSTWGERVPHDGEMARKKALAQAQHASQWAVENCLPHFLQPLEEYTVPNGHTMYQESAP